MNTHETIPVETWQFYAALKKILGKNKLTTFFSVSPRQIDRWSCDPDYSESARRNPSDRYEGLLKKLMELGREDIARAVVDRQARIVGCTLTCNSAVPDKSTLQEELLDNLTVLAKYQEAHINGESPAVIREAAHQVIDEILQDLTFVEATE
jgi:hypothetical protein